MNRLSDVVYQVQLVGQRRTVVLHHEVLTTVKRGSSAHLHALSTPQASEGRPGRLQCPRQLPAQLKDFVLKAWIDRDT